MQTRPTPAQTTRLLIRLSSLGDLVLCSALVQKLQAEFANDPLIFITEQGFQEFVQESFPQPLRVEGVRSEGFGAALYFVRGVRLAKELYLQRSASEYFEIYDLHGVAKSQAFVMGFRSYCRFKNMQLKTFATSKASFLRWLSIILGKDLLGKRFIYQAHLQLDHTTPPSLSPPSGTTKKSSIPPVDLPVARANNFYPRLLTDGAPKSMTQILVAPDAKHWKKKWISSHWHIFLNELLNSNPHYALTLVGGPTCLPIDLIDELEARFGSRVTNLLGKTKLTQLASLAAQHALTICGNSAWLHISEAAGTPVISLAGPIVPGFGFSPWRADSVELSVPLNCRPCTRHGGGVCKLVGDEFHACMKLISPEQVLLETKKLLERKA